MQLILKRNYFDTAGRKLVLQEHFIEFELFTCTSVITIVGLLSVSGEIQYVFVSQ